ncbi:intermembrane phospholipid transport protein YdbH family protein [Azospirillum sp. sgz302134]
MAKGWSVRRGLVWLAVGGGAIAVLAVYRAELAGGAATLALRQAGFPDAAVTVTDLAPAHSRATLRLDKVGAVGGTVTIEHPLSTLLKGRIAKLVLSQGRLRLDAGKDGRLRLAGLPLTGGKGDGGASGGGIALPVDDLRVEDAAVTLATPQGTAHGSLRLAMTGVGTEQQGTATLTASAKGLPTLAAWMGAGPVTEAAGTLTAKARFRWGGEGLKGEGDVRIADLGGRFGPIAVSGINGVVRLSSLLPPVVPPGQTLAVKLLDVGLPLTDGTIRFGYGRNGRLSVEQAEWRWAGGLLRAEPVEINPAAPKGTVALRAEGIPLGPLLNLAAVEGLEATGTVSGHLPVRFAPDGIHLDGGVLEADAPGTLRYDPARPPGFLQGEEGSPTDMLMGALTDFRYESLRATVDGQAGGDLRVGFAIRGANPAFYDGYPVALNLKVSGALDRILRQSLDSYRIPDAVRDRMTEFERRNP